MATPPSPPPHFNIPPRNGGGRPSPYRFVFVAAVVALVVCVLLAEANPARAAEREGPAADSAAVVNCAPFPVTAQHRYRMLAKIRPLLFWMSRDDVGEARAVWRHDADGGRGYELLIGSDPAKAPMKVNRWGYIAEQVHGTEACLLGVMKQSNEASIAEAKSRVAAEGRDGPYVFKAIRAVASADQARAGVSTVSVSRNLTLHDLPMLLDVLNAPSRSSATRSVQLPPGTRPGFLIAFAELIHASAAGYLRAGTSSSAPPPPLVYVYNDTLNDLTLRRSERVSRWRMGEQTRTNVIRANFESLNRKTRELSKFEVVYATDGPLAEVPLHATYQPNWWFHVELVLDDAGPL